MHTDDDKKKSPETKSPGYELSDVNISATLIFLAGLMASVIIFFFVCWAMGKIFTAELAREDGPISHWRAGGPQDKTGNLMPSHEMEQEEYSKLVNTFPAPRVQTDDGNQDIADLHAREDLYLDHYSWVDDTHTAVRIPIERAMELIVERGLPTVPASTKTAEEFTGDNAPVVTAPLTNGFARTGYEQEQMELQREKLNEEAPAETK